MAGGQARFGRLLLFIGLLIVAGLACNAPTRDRVSPTETQTPTNSPTSEPETVPESTSASATAESEEDVEETEESEETPLPTFTSNAPPTLRPTETSTSTPRPRPVVTSVSTTRPTVSPTTTESVGPLRLEYYVEWRLKDAAAKQAIASVTLTARGGGGGYKFYRDNLPLDGPMFEYEWSTCSGNPGSFRVDSADGQSVKIDYFENPPCPTPTPTR